MIKEHFDALTESDSMTADLLLNLIQHGFEKMAFYDGTTVDIAARYFIYAEKRASDAKRDMGRADLSNDQI